MQSLKISALAASMMLLCSNASYAHHSWGNYHWARTSNPFTLKLGDNLTSTNWKSRLAQASSNWNTGSGTVLTAIVRGTASTKCNMVKGTTQVCNGKYGYNGWLGLASINITADGHITQGTAKLNDTYFASPTYNTLYEKQHVMCQEIAHTFGLDHQSTDGRSLNTCMDYFSNTGINANNPISTKPNAHDFEQLNIIYQHIDSINTVATATSLSAAFVDITSNPQSWGQLIQQSRNGRSSQYSRANSDGTRTITNVYWTLEAAENCPTCDHRDDH